MKVDDLSAAVVYYMPKKETVFYGAAVMTAGAIALQTLCSVPSASAGPITYTACAAICATLAPPAIPACLSGCLPSLGPWCI